MEKLTVLILLLAFALGAKASSSSLTKLNDLRIDCGVKGDVAEMINNFTWLSDGPFTDSGEIQHITPESTLDVPQFLSTLRYFPEGEDRRHCYTLPLVNTYKFIFRAGFYYANYDGKSQPPVFDLQLGGQLWTTVTISSSDDPLFEEVVYWPRNDETMVCLVGRKDGGRPFISSLEATALDEISGDKHGMYEEMKNDRLYRLVGRVNFGVDDQVVEPWSRWANGCEETQNRYWTPQRRRSPGLYTNLSFGNSTVSCTGHMYQNCPPDSVITTAVTASHSNPSKSIYTPIHFPSSSATAYIVLYFYQSLSSSQERNATRIMDIYVDGVRAETVRFLEHTSVQVVTLYPVSVGAVANLTISPVQWTVLPPLINAMEVFTATPMDQESPGDGFKVPSSYILAGILHVFVGAWLVWV